MTEILYVTGNSISGTLPEEMGNLTKLQEFLAHFNEIEGPIPAGFFGITSIRVLRLDNNKITGDIAAEIGNLSALTDLRLNNNTFSGPFPDTIQSAKGLGKSSMFLLLVKYTKMSITHLHSFLARSSQSSFCWPTTRSMETFPMSLLVLETYNSLTFPTMALPEASLIPSLILLLHSRLSMCATTTLLEDFLLHTHRLFK